MKTMNLLKGNINQTNEMIDKCKTKRDLKDNVQITKLLQTLEEMEPKLLEELQKDVDDEDIMTIYLQVNEDLQRTFKRYKDLKQGKQPQPFSPCEYVHRNTIQYLIPTHYYGAQSLKQEFLENRSIQSGSSKNSKTRGDTCQVFSQIDENYSIAAKNNSFSGIKFEEVKQMWPGIDCLVIQDIMKIVEQHEGLKVVNEQDQP